MKSQKTFLSKLINGIFIVVVFVGLYFIFRKFDVSRLDYIKEHINYGLLILVWLITVLSMVLMILRWYYLLKPIKPGVSLQNVFRVSIHAFAVNFAVPGKMGVPAKAILLKKLEDVDIAHSTPSLLGELFLEYSVMSLFLLSSAIAGGFWEKAYQLMRHHLFTGNVGSLAVAVFVLTAAVLLFWKKIATSNFFVQLKGAFQSTRARQDLFLISLLITVGNLFVTFFADMMLYRCFGFNIPYVFIVFAGGLSNITGLLSPLPGGLGAREISCAYLYEVFYGMGEIAVAVVLIRRLMTYSALIILFLLERATEYCFKKKFVQERANASGFY